MLCTFYAASPRTAAAVELALRPIAGPDFSNGSGGLVNIRPLESNLWPGHSYVVGPKAFHFTGGFEGPFTTVEEKLYELRGSELHAVEAEGIHYESVEDVFFTEDGMYFYDGRGGVLNVTESGLSHIELPRGHSSGSLYVKRMSQTGGDLVLFLQDQRANPTEDVIVRIRDGLAEEVAVFQPLSVTYGAELSAGFVFTGDGAVQVFDGSRVERISQGAGNYRSDYVSINDTALVRASLDRGWELYRTNGASVELLADINPTGDSNPRVHGLGLFNDELFFFAQSSWRGYDIYRTDGTTVSQVPSPLLSTPSPFGVYASDWYFTDYQQNRVDLYATDGDQVRLLESPIADVQIGYINFFFEVHESAVFTVRDSDWDKHYLWSSDGESVRSLGEFEYFDSIRDPSSGDLIIAGAVDGVASLYRTDGLSVTPLDASFEETFVGVKDLVWTDDHLLMLAVHYDGENYYRQLYDFDGTSVSPFATDPLDNLNDLLVLDGGRVFLTGLQGESNVLLEVVRVPEPSTAIACFLLATLMHTRRPARAKNC